MGRFSGGHGALDCAPRADRCSQALEIAGRLGSQQVPWHWSLWVGAGASPVISLNQERLRSVHSEKSKHPYSHRILVVVSDIYLFWSSFKLMETISPRMIHAKAFFHQFFWPLRTVCLWANQQAGGPEVVGTSWKMDDAIDITHHWLRWAGGFNFSLMKPCSHWFSTCFWKHSALLCHSRNIGICNCLSKRPEFGWFRFAWTWTWTSVIHDCRNGHHFHKLF